jgi:hypothetical protein
MAWYRWEKKETTDDYIRLDVRMIHRKGCLYAGFSGNWNWSRRGERFAWIAFEVEDGQIRLRYKTRSRGEDEWQDRDYPVAVEWLPCHFGGTRPWFRCPCCQRRAAILYGSKYFACRRCLNLSYDSQRERPYYRALSKAQGIHEKLGGTGCIDDPIFKPKGMHWRTYSRHMARFEDAHSRAVPPFLLKYI